jgi:nucleotide-binding universal stress UspA family protein
MRVAEEEGCDLIVLGSRGLSDVKAFLIGSVSDRVAYQAHCPVLIVK